mgnify:FL=1|jgi:hypothetical protein|tara:strand:+ start:927 stop:1169 length:243 start_codon:yes stop_codon:yes gene_type:complete
MIITQNMSMVYHRPYVLGAWIDETEDGWYYHIQVDEGTEEGAEGAHLSAIISKRFDSYDNAVIAMNQKLRFEMVRDSSDA